MAGLLSKEMAVSTMESPTSLGVEFNLEEIPTRHIQGIKTFRYLKVSRSYLKKLNLGMSEEFFQREM